MGNDGRPILVVDDDPTIREGLRLTLEGEGYPVIAARDGAEALRLVERCAPACVVLDVQMPVLDGRGVARALRARGLDLPIVVMTAAGEARAWADELEVVMTAAAEARAWADELGAAASLAKPFELARLVEAVEHACAP